MAWLQYVSEQGGKKYTIYGIWMYLVSQNAASNSYKTMLLISKNVDRSYYLCYKPNRARCSQKNIYFCKFISHLITQIVLCKRDSDIHSFI